MTAAALSAPAAAAHGTGFSLMKLFHWTCIGSMVCMAAAHGGSLLTMASNFINMHIIPGLAAAPQAISNIGTAFAHAVGIGAAPAIDPTMIMDHSPGAHAAHAASTAAIPDIQGDWFQSASPALKSAFTTLPPDALAQFNQASPALQASIVDNFTAMSSVQNTATGSKIALGDIIKSVCQPR